jgi:hypothetical protein
MSVVPLASLGNRANYQLAYNITYATFDTTIVPSNSDKISTNQFGFSIRQTGLLEVNYSITSSTGGTVIVGAVPPSQALPYELVGSRMYIPPNTTASRTFYFRNPYVAYLVIANRNDVSHAPIQFGTTASDSANSFNIVFNVKYISP